MKGAIFFSCGVVCGHVMFVTYNAVISHAIEIVSFRRERVSVSYSALSRHPGGPQTQLASKGSISFSGNQHAYLP